MSRTLTRRLLGFSTAAIAALSLGAVAQAQEKKLKIGVIYDLTGPLAGGGSATASVEQKRTPRTVQEIMRMKPPWAFLIRLGERVAHHFSHQRRQRMVAQLVKGTPEPPRQLGHLRPPGGHRQFQMKMGKGMADHAGQQPPWSLDRSLAGGILPWQLWGHARCPTPPPWPTASTCS